MRRLLLALALLAPALASAGPRAGALKLSGAAGYAYSKSTLSAEGTDEELTVKTNEARLEGYYLLFHGLGIGAWLELQSTKQDLLGGELKTTDLLVGPALTGELPLAEELGLFVDAAFLFGKSTVSSDGTEETEDSKGFGAAGGIAWHASRDVSLELGARYVRLTSEIEGVSVTRSGLGFEAGFTVYFGGSDASTTPSGRRVPATGSGRPSPW